MACLTWARQRDRPTVNKTDLAPGLSEFADGEGTTNTHDSIMRSSEGHVRTVHRST